MSGILLKCLGSSENYNYGKKTTVQELLNVGFYVHVHTESYKRGEFEWFMPLYGPVRAPGRFLQLVEDISNDVCCEVPSDAEALRKVADLLDQGYFIDFTIGPNGYFMADAFVLRNEVK